MFRSLSNSWELVKASAAVLRSDKELVVFPIVSAIGVLIVSATFAIPLFLAGLFDQMYTDGEGFQPLGMLVAFLFYLVQYFVIFFANTALVGAAMIRLEGGDPTVRDGFRIAFSKAGKILGYAAIAATVGVILRAIEERLGLIGRWVVALIGVAWTVVTYLTVPVLVAQDVGPLDAVKESAKLLKKTWGENLIGAGGLGLVFGLASFVVVLLGIGATVLLIPTKSWVLMGSAVGIMVVLVLMLTLVQTALSGIYSAALYRYAVGHESSAGFSPELLQAAFQPKKAK